MIGGCVGGFILACSFLIFQENPRNKLEEKVDVTKQQEKNYFEINDDVLGVKFHLSKNFYHLTAQAVSVKNPDFIYGFSAKDDMDVYCVISQDKMEQPGAVKLEYLRDGVYNQIRKKYPDAKLESYEVVNLGWSNNGVRLIVNYTDNAITMVQWEVAGINGESATFAFCNSPKTKLNLYKEDFNLFLDSIEVK